MFSRHKLKTAENSITLDDAGVIRLTYKGLQTRETLVAIKGQLLKAMAEQRAAGKQVKVMADMRGVTGSDSGARLESKWFLEEADWDVLAVLGNRYLQPLIFFVLRDFRHSRKIVKYFTDERRAAKWLDHPTRDQNFNRLKPHNRLKWAMLVLIALTMAATFSSWRQSKERIKLEADNHFTQTVLQSTEAVEERIGVYLQALYGFRGLFHASDMVNEREYHDYFASLEIGDNYPGVNSINFVSQVSEAEKAAFIAQMRADTSLRPEGDPDFAIVPETTLDEHFIVTYVGTAGAGSDRGVDLAINEERRTALQTARDSGEPTATKTIRLFDSQGREQQDETGFLITIPIYDDGDVPGDVAGRHARHEGFVNAVFNYRKLFDQSFAHVNLHGAAVRIFDSDGAVTYQKGSVEGDALDTVVSFPVAGQTWKMEVRAPQLFGLGRIEARSPRIVLTLGIMLTSFLVVVLWQQNRGRKQAINLASAMTEDIKMERNEAIAIKNKDEAILSSIGDGVLVLDTDGRVVLFNKAAERISGFTADEVRDKTYTTAFSFVNDKTGEPANQFIDKALMGVPGRMAASTVLKRKDGTSLPVADSAAPVHNALGQVTGAVVVFRDVTRERQLERMKDELLSVASHELRTPMGAVRANVAMILDGDYGPVNKELVEPLTDIKASTVRLVELVNDLLSVARLEAGRMKFTLSEFDPQDVIKKEVNNLAPLGKEKNVKIEFQPGESSVIVQADQDKIKQVLNNLIGNALKFTEQGSITVAAQLQDDKVEVTIADTGIGISPQDQKKLFGKFQQITSVQDGKPAGTGLGLYISREMIHKMGGDMLIKQSEVGKGSTFAFTMPIAKSQDAERVKIALEREAEEHPDQR